MSAILILEIKFGCVFQRIYFLNYTRSKSILNQGIDANFFVDIPIFAK